MGDYIPFLKTKTNEFSALKALDCSIANNMAVFLDINAKIEKKYTEDEYIERIQKITKKIDKNVKSFRYFYIDDYDIQELSINGENSYKFVLSSLHDFNFIPVIGIDRSDSRNEIVFNNYKDISSKSIAMRITYNDLNIGFYDFKELYNNIPNYFIEKHLIIDLRLIPQNINTNDYCNDIEKFLLKSKDLFSKIIITGSIIPDIFSDLVKTDSDVVLNRTEVDIFKILSKKYDIIFGDYTIVSPYYSDKQINPSLFRTLTAPRVLYAFDDKFYIQRGHSIKNDNQQYIKFCEILKLKPFFRGELFSFGDNFIANINNHKSTITPSSILKPTINAHITYMYNLINP